MVFYLQCKRQYMSAIFYHDDEQKVLAEESMDKQKASAKGKPITTLILPAEKFYIAEE
jgi:peptide methionine sulfoxide reductase MsrA